MSLSLMTRKSLPRGGNHLVQRPDLGAGPRRVAGEHDTRGNLRMARAEALDHGKRGIAGIAAAEDNLKRG